MNPQMQTNEVRAAVHLIVLYGVLTSKHRYTLPV